MSQEIVQPQAEVELLRVAIRGVKRSHPEPKRERRSDRWRVDTHHFVEKRLPLQNAPERD